MDHAAQSSPLDAVLSALDLVLFERRSTGLLELASKPPFWLAASGSRDLVMRVNEHDADLHPFLAHFLHDAERFWAAGREGRLKSDVWLEGREDGAEDCYQASALLLPGQRALLTIELVRDFATERQAPLQAARDSRLHFERLQKETEKKEVLLHCIVHDLKGPLAGMLGVLSLMKQHELAPGRVRELTELGVSQARKQESMIQGILEVFASEITALEVFERDPARAPDLARAAKSVVEMLRPAYARKDVALGLDIERGSPSSGAAGVSSADEPLLVVGHPQRLERVIANLLENALRYSPQRSNVEVKIREHGARVQLSVEDRGPGLTEAVRAQLFEKFVQDPSLGGTAGLGLYFCRMNVERWGGRIGCEPREGGGSRFWFDLPRATST